MKSLWMLIIVSCAQSTPPKTNDARPETTDILISSNGIKSFMIGDRVRYNIDGTTHESRIIALRENGAILENVYTVIPWDSMIPITQEIHGPGQRIIRSKSPR